VDSIASPFRHSVSNMAQRMQLLTALTHKLTNLASADQSSMFAVVMMNQITTKFGRSNHSYQISMNDGDTCLIPSLGDSWGHMPTNRVMLYWKEKSRVAHLFKSSYRKEGTAYYDITASGISDIDPSVVNKRPRTDEFE
jgi:uncharacterized protein YprB with RNaseH-like and TPR domain